MESETAINGNSKPIMSSLPRFHDERSRRQIAAYMRDALPGAKARNEQNLAHWNAHLRQPWKLQRIGTARPRP